MKISSDATKQKLHDVIFESNTPIGKAFDIFLICVILISVVVVLLDSVSSIGEKHGLLLNTLEWTFTIVFTLEYVARIYVLKKPAGYIKSFYGVIDLVSFLPTYLALIFVDAQTLMVFRIFRLLRIFRVLKLVRFLTEGNQLFFALRASMPKITVFLVGVFCINIINGTLIYIVEGHENGFDSIPRGIYWSIVTMTTVGYGDISPQTVVGQTLASIIMIMGYGIIAVPTGIVTSKMYDLKGQSQNARTCDACGKGGHTADAKYCKHCGEEL